MSIQSWGCEVFEKATMLQKSMKMQTLGMHDIAFLEYIFLAQIQVFDT